jgi:hypothetical protein
LAFYLFKTWGPPTGKYVMRSYPKALPESKLAELRARDQEYAKKFWPNRAVESKEATTISESSTTPV